MITNLRARVAAGRGRAGGDEPRAARAGGDDRRAGRGETRLVRGGLAVIGLRVLDDTVLQPPAGVPVTERPLAALVPLALLALVAFTYPRLRATVRGGWPCSWACSVRPPGSTPCTPRGSSGCPRTT